MAENKQQGIIQFIKFGIVGVSNTMISYLIYVAVIFLCEAFDIWQKADYILATAISFALSVLWAFYWNKRFVFELDGTKKNILLALLKTYISYSFSGLFLKSLLSVFWVEIMNVSKFLVPFLCLIITVPVNFLLNKFWAFKKK